MISKRNCDIALLRIIMVVSLGLVACSNGDVQIEPTVDSTSSNNLTEPQYYSGIWFCFENANILLDYGDYAIIYDFDWDNRTYSYYLKAVYECEYQWDGDELTLSAYDPDGVLIYTNSYISGGGQLVEADGGGEDYYVRSRNVGVRDDLVGIWHYLIPCTGHDLQFYNDGSFRDDEFDGRGTFTSDGDDGRYMLTSKYDRPAIAVYDEDRENLGTFRYEFLETNLLVIYDSDGDKIQSVFYRDAYDPNEK